MDKVSSIAKDLNRDFHLDALVTRDVVPAVIIRDWASEAVPVDLTFSTVRLLTDPCLPAMDCAAALEDIDADIE